MTEPTYQIGFTSPMFRDWPARLPKRNPIGFVVFGQPEEEPDVVIAHPDVRRKQEDRRDKQRWIEAMAADDTKFLAQPHTGALASARDDRCGDDGDGSGHDGSRARGRRCGACGVAAALFEV
jgi:hypothetical protein